MKSKQKNYLSQNNRNCLLKSLKDIFLLVIVFNSSFNAQVVNYVNNPSFEDLVQNNPYFPFDGGKYWSPIDSLKCNCHYIMAKPPHGNVPYGMFGFQYPRNGSNFIYTSFFCNNCPRAFPFNRLKQLLKPNTTYCAKYYMVNTNNNRVAIENYGMHFGDASIDTITKCDIPLTYLIPQIEYSGPIITDTLRWTAISGTFVANGTEKYMILGNFRSNAATNTMVLNTPTLQTMSNDIYIDDVSLVEMDLPAFAGRDTLVFPGDSVFIGRESDVGIDEACIWYKLPDLINPIDTVAGFWINPTATATYVVKQQLWCSNVPKWDTVVVETSIYVGLESDVLLLNTIQLFPNPADNYLELKIKNEEIKTAFHHLSIYDQLGQLIKEEALRPFDKLRAQQPDGTFKIKTNDLPPGVYFLRISGNEGTVSKRFLISR